MTLRLAWGLTIGAAAWLVLLVLAPFLIQHQAFGGAAAYLYAIGSQICHQRTERSFALSGVQLPVCARCFGLYLSGAVGTLAAWVVIAGPLASPRLLLGLAAVPTAVTWALEAAGIMPFSNVARALAALPLGAAGGWVFVRMLRYDAESHGRETHHRRTPARLG